METLWLRLGTRTLVYVLLALGLNLVLGETGLLHLGYVAFFAVGAYTTAIFSSPRLGYHWNFWVIIALATLLSMVFGFIIGFPTLRLRGDYLAIVTLAFGEITRITFNNWENVTNGPGGIPGIYPPSIFGWVVDKPVEFYYLLLVTVVLVVIVLANVKNSRVGRAWNALREDEIAANHAGVHSMSTKMLAVVISSGIAGLAGAIFAYYQQFINPTYFLFMQSVIVVCMVVLGGMGSIPGAIAGAVVLDMTPRGHPPGLHELATGCAWPQLPAGCADCHAARLRSLSNADVRCRHHRDGDLQAGRSAARTRCGAVRPTRKTHASRSSTRQRLFDFDEGHQDLEV